MLCFCSQEGWPSPGYLHGETSSVAPPVSPYPAGCSNPTGYSGYGYEDKQLYCPNGNILETGGSHHSDPMQQFHGNVLDPCRFLGMHGAQLSCRGFNKNGVLLLSDRRRDHSYNHSYKSVPV